MNPIRHVVEHKILSWLLQRHGLKPCLWLYSTYGSADTAKMELMWENEHEDGWFWVNDSLTRKCYYLVLDKEEYASDEKILSLLLSIMQMNGSALFIDNKCTEAIIQKGATAESLAIEYDLANT